MNPLILHPGFPLLQKRLKDLELSVHVLHPAQVKRVLEDGWVLVIDERLYPAIAYYACPMEDLAKHF